ncbi:MAG: DUF4139 domain-containing protein [Candidatus Eisenbacteria bacterium]|nr:DUF4139 domain-containing protein [Candidatus Eisenbacteria bacterium]
MRAIRLFRGAVWGILLLVNAAAASGESPRVAVTVYNRDLGVVRERRVIELRRGDVLYSFTDVAAEIDPTSVHFRAVDGRGDLEVLEQNYEYDLVSSDKLFDKYVGSPVDVFFSRSGDVLSGTLLARRGGLILQDAGGERVSVVLGDLRNVEIHGDAADFVTRPTLVWTLRNESAGARTVEVEYLTGGMNWHAEYVALANEENTTVEFAGWVSVDNRSGADYEEARLKLLAGDVGRADYVRGGRAEMDGVQFMAKAPQVEERALFEYHIYEVQRPTTLRDNQVKQILFVPNSAVPVTKEYLYQPTFGPDKIGVYLEFENREERGLGLPLPAGLVRVFQDDGRGGSEFIGEDRIDHTARNEKVRLRVGYAFDLVGERKVLAERRIADRVRERDVEIRLRNRKEEPVEIKVRERVEAEWSMEKESHPHRREDAGTAEWVVAVGADEEMVLTYTVRVRY